MVAYQKINDSRLVFNKQRLLWDLLLLLVFIWGPWWLLVAVVVVGAFWFNYYWEGVIAIFVLESVFMVRTILFPYIFTIGVLLAMLMIEKSKKFLIFYN